MTYCFKYFITATNGPPTGGPHTGGPHTGGPHTGFIGVKSTYKGLLPKQHIKYKTKKLLNAIKLHVQV
jgi:glycine cleavage system protein P-like pyridoxal-binding family